MLLLVLRPRLAATNTFSPWCSSLTANVIADLRLAQLIATGVVRGDWELAVAFSVAPMPSGTVYAHWMLLRTTRAAVRSRYRNTATAIWLIWNTQRGNRLSESSRSA